MFIGTAHDIQVVVSVLVGVEKGGAGVFFIFVFCLMNRFLRESPISVLKKKLSGKLIGASHKKIIEAVFVHIGHGQTGTLLR